jgi:3-deoxy-D-manno-octulosonic-acid transferase
MLVLYNFLILSLRTLFRIASLFHPKAKAFVKGRKGVYKRMKVVFAIILHRPSGYTAHLWGEFEQARPLIEILKKEYQGIKILLTFFSPSGFEVRKNYDKVDLVSYLPWDSASHCVEAYIHSKTVRLPFL